MERENGKICASNLHPVPYKCFLIRSQHISNPFKFDTTCITTSLHQKITNKRHYKKKTMKLQTVSLRTRVIKINEYKHKN